MTTMRQHFARFFSPGTFFSEINEEPVDACNVDEAVMIAGTIVQRYNARPYGFCFITRERSDDDLDSHEATKSPMYYLGGKIETLADVEARADPRERILRSNMRINNIPRILRNENSWSWCQPPADDDVVLDVTLPTLEK